MINALSKKLLGLLLAVTAVSYADDFEQPWNIKGGVRISVAPLIKHFAVHADELPIVSEEKVKESDARAEEQERLFLELDKLQGSTIYDIDCFFRELRSRYAQECTNGSAEKETCKEWMKKIDLHHAYKKRQSNQWAQSGEVAWEKATRFARK